MPTWDAYRPSNFEPWNVGDGRIRDNFSFWETFAKLVSTFALNPADPTDRAANKIKFGSTAGRPVTTVAEQTGIAYFDVDTGRFYVCVDGTTNTWDEQDSFSALNVVGALSAGSLSVTGATSLGGAATLLGGLLIAAAGDLTLATGRRQIVPSPAEQWLRQGSDNMNPHTHGAPRHRLTGSDGAWVSAKDPLALLIQDIQFATHAITESNFAGPSKKAAVTRNFTGRSGNSRVLALGMARIGKRADNTMGRARIERAGSPGSIGQWQAVPFANGNNDLEGCVFCFDWFTGVTAASHEFAVWVGNDTPGAISGTIDYVESAILIIDFGDAV